MSDHAAADAAAFSIGMAKNKQNSREKEELCAIISSAIAKDVKNFHDARSQSTERKIVALMLHIAHVAP